MENRRTVLITGASGGIGDALVSSFLHAGYRVVASDMEESPELLEKWGKIGEVVMVTFDLTNLDKLGTFIEKVERPFGSVDVLINNAGVMSYDDLLTTTLKDWDRVQRINVTVPWLLSQKLVSKMMNNYWGRVINISSTGGKNPSSITGSAYAVSKATLNYLTKKSAYEWGENGVTVNGIAPGPVRTKMAESFSDEKIDKLLSLSRIKRMCEPQEVADFAVFISSEQAGYMTGEIIDLNGGSFID